VLAVVDEAFGLVDVVVPVRVDLFADSPPGRVVKVLDDLRRRAAVDVA